MFNLIKFEFKKLAKKRTNIITVLVSVILTIIFFSLPATRFEYTDTKGVDYRGLKAIALAKENIKTLSFKITDEQIEKDIKEYQKLCSNPENVQKYESGQTYLKNDIFVRYVEPKYGYLSLIAGNYSKDNEDYYLNSLKKIKFQDGAKFYETRESKISTFLNSNHKGGNYSEQEKTFWLNKNSKIQKPYTYGFHEGWELMIGIFGTLIFPLLAICITVAPVFAGEYQCGADAVILSAKYGKTKVVKAKIISAFAFSTIVFFLNAIFAVAMTILTFGIDGWNLPMQIGNISIPYSFTYASGILVGIATAYVIMLGMVSFTLFLSAKLKTAFSVLIIDMIVLFFSLFLKDGVDNGLYNHILYLLPYKAHEFKYSSYLSYSFGGLTMSLISMRIVVYAFITVILLPFAKRAFSRHQVR